VATHDPLAEFIRAACVPPDSHHLAGTLEDAEGILAAHPEIKTSTVHVAAILGDDAAVRSFVTADPAKATAKGGPHGWDPLTHLCFSKYLRLDRQRSAGFVRAAQALLDAGANPNSGFFSHEHVPEPEYESVLYGAAGIAHDAELTRILVQRGADPNNEEVVYHTPETWDNAALKILLESGKLTAASLARMLLRKTDWHDYDGIKMLLEHGTDPNQLTRWGKTALHNALLSDNRLKIVELLLDHGADATVPGTHPEVYRSGAGKSSVWLAAERGRDDVLELFERRGIPIELQGSGSLMAACARKDEAAVRSIAGRDPAVVSQLQAEGGRVLAQFAGNGNTEGVRHLLDLGVDIEAPSQEEDFYWGIAKNSTALHVAAWRARHATVKLLIERGAQVDRPDGKGRTPLALAVRACVDSYWTHLRSPESVRALLEAGAPVTGVQFPSGYAEVDALLEAHGLTRTNTDGT